MPAMDEPGQAEPRGPDFVARERAQRLAKQERLNADGGPAYGYDRDHTLAQVRAEFDGLAAGEESGERVRVAGRLMLIRRHGGLVFADLKDQTGTVQLLFSRSDGVLDGVSDLDRGDWIGVAGTGMRTRKGELSIRVREWRLLTKSLRALPDKHKGLTDVDTRLRERYLDLIVNPSSRRIFDIRSAVIASVRRTLSERGFTEVETPVLDAAAVAALAAFAVMIAGIAFLALRRPAA
jgi:lysyl-tRNA synthetase class 2